ncbi:hypothetical protein WS50_30130 [Burkholderia territorii]|uniref:hypothetical protein n=1 Tax=Burkholderia territorii TaxID=1503055 RepID=UPI000754780A|nr:hypothetical protein [Burkholderia territorii]KUZ00052.1 hypothetical protein WS47_00275 [Burkholderia territorii]KUZ05511.1 hypothetical protein WS50_30130 [Burkholderia territorii]
MDASQKTPLTFFQQAISEPFKNDSNADIGEVFIALVYPEILIRDADGDTIIDCRQEGFYAEADNFPLLRFLEMFPDICNAIIEESSQLKQRFERSGFR